MMQDEKEKHEQMKNKINDQCNEKGRKLVEERTKKAQQDAKDIYEKSKKLKIKLRNSYKSRYDKAIKMILDNLVE